MKTPKLLLLLHRNPTCSVTFATSPPSPNKKVSLIPVEARRKRSQKPSNGICSFDSTKEPTSPQVSCLGQLKKKKPNSGVKPNGICCVVEVDEVEVVRVKGSKRVDFDFEEEKNKVKVKVNQVLRHENDEIKVPSLGQMRRFESGRGVLSHFDWKTTDYSSTTFGSSKFRIS